MIKRILELIAVLLLLVGMLSLKGCNQAPQQLDQAQTP
jgi:Tfp pilus assembly protein PilV